MTTDLDPRQPSARAFHIDADGYVDGMELRVIKIGNPKFVAKSVAVISEREAGQNMSAKVFVTDAQGLPIIGARVNLFWPWSGSNTQISFENSQAPGNNNYPIDHVIGSIFDPNAQPPKSHLGPLAIAPVDEKGVIIGDIVAGFGMPGEIGPDGKPKGGRHMCFQVLYVAAPAAPTPDPAPNPEPEPDDTDDGADPGAPSNDAARTLAQVRIGDELAGIKDLMRRLVEHFGA